MKELFSRFFRTSIISSFIFLLFGIIFLVDTDSVLVSLAIFIGIILLVLGVVSLSSYFKDRLTDKYASNDFLTGIFTIVLSVILLINKSSVLFKLIPIFAGCWLIINGYYKVEFAMELKDNKSKLWIWSIIFAIITLVVGMLLVINPLKSSVIVNMVIALAIIGHSIINIFEAIILNVKIKKIVKDIKKRK